MILKKGGTCPFCSPHPFKLTHHFHSKVSTNSVPWDVPSSASSGQQGSLLKEGHYRFPGGWGGGIGFRDLPSFQNPSFTPSLSLPPPGLSRPTSFQSAEDVYPRPGWRGGQKPDSLPGDARARPPASRPSSAEGGDRGLETLPCLAKKRPRLPGIPTATGPFSQRLPSRPGSSKP